MIFGFNTKALRVSDKLIEQLSRKTIKDSSYLSLSVMLILMRLII